jgi:hypothetical protein
MIAVHICKGCKARWLPVVLKPPTKPKGPPTCPRCGADAPKENTRKP